MTWSDLVAEVRAQIDVDDDTALGWLLDCARVMNAEAAWLLSEATLAGVDGEFEYDLPPDCLRTEAVIVNSLPYKRATLMEMDSARATGSCQRIYSDAVESAARVFAISPPPSTGATIILRYLADVPDVSDPATESPPFPSDIVGVLADGGIAQGLARMDERFDSAGYFDAKFTDGIARLRRRRHGRVGKGPITIRLGY